LGFSKQDNKTGKTEPKKPKEQIKNKYGAGALEV
jgi:hypothetical protein